MQKFLLNLILISSLISTAQVKIGDNVTTVGTSSLLELEDSSKALVITRVANTAAITNPVNGMIVYDLSSNSTKFYQNNSWSTSNSATTGAFITSPITNTLNFRAVNNAPTKGSIITDRCTTWREGGFLCGSINFAQSAAGLAGSGTYLIGINQYGLIDTNLIVVNTNNLLGDVVGFGELSNSQFESSNSRSPVHLRVYDDSNLMVTVQLDNGSYLENKQQNWGSGFYQLSQSVINLQATFKIPIVGWTSNMVLSSSVPLGEVSAKYRFALNQTVNMNGLFIYTQKDWDTYNLYNSSTGMGTIPYTGLYTFSGVYTGNSSPANAEVRVIINGLTNEVIAITNTAGLGRGTFSGTFHFTSGDTWQIQGLNANGNMYTANIIYNWFAIKYESQNQTIATDPSVICQYISTNNPNITNTFIVFNQLDTRCGDSHNAYNITTGEYTAPVSGRYQIDMNFMTAGMPAGSSLALYPYINGVQQGTSVTDCYTPTNERNRMRLNGFVIKLNAGDKFKLYNTASANAIIDNPGGGVYNYLSIKRIGNL